MAEGGFEDLAAALIARRRELNSELYMAAMDSGAHGGWSDSRLARLAVVEGALEQLRAGAGPEEFGAYLDKMANAFGSGQPGWRKMGVKAALDELGDIKGEFGSRFSPGLPAPAL